MPEFTFESIIGANFSDHDETVMWARGVAGASRDMSVTDIEFQDL